MNIKIIFLLFLIVSTLSGCLGRSPETSNQETGNFSATVTITDDVLNTVYPLIFGDNIEWVKNGMGLWIPSENRLDKVLVEELRNVGITHLRYPGGTLSDYFDWYKAIGKERQLITNPFENIKEYPHFGPEELKLLCEKLGIPATITLNAGTGKPEDAIKWVEYLNVNKYNVTDYTVGNEIYMANPKEPIAKTVQQYIEFYSKCYEGIRKISPNAKIGAIGLHDSGAMPLSQNRDWMRDILNNIGDKMDFVDVHNGYAPVIRPTFAKMKKRYPDDDFAQCFMGASVYVQENINLTKTDIEQYAPNGGKNIDIHITEYGPLVYPIDKKHAVEDVSWNRTLTGALYLACFFNVILKEPKITSANHLPLCQDVFAALIGITGTYPNRKNWRNIVYYVFQDYAKMANRDVMSVKVDAPTYSTQSMGIVPKLDNVPYIDAGAYKTKDTLTVFLINRSVKNSASVNIDTGLASFSVKRISTLTHDSYKAENNSNNPYNVIPEKKEFEQITQKGLFNLSLPKHSLTIIDFSII
jgi:alpha-N-arabinofuranosidase